MRLDNHLIIMTKRWTSGKQKKIELFGQNIRALRSLRLCGEYNIIIAANHLIREIRVSNLLHRFQDLIHYLSCLALDQVVADFMG